MLRIFSFINKSKTFAFIAMNRYGHFTKVKREKKQDEDIKKVDIFGTF